MAKKEALQIVRRFICAQDVASLSTLSLKYDGHPFGSVVPYDIDREGNIIIFISLISEHYKNICADDRVSLLVSDRFGVSDPQAHARATFMGTASPVPETEINNTQGSYWRRFPFGRERAIAHNFVFFRIAALKLRWIGGFGDIRWIDAEEYKQTSHDTVAYESKAIIDHMNADHRDALQELLKFQLQLDVDQQACRMTAVDSEGFSVAVIGSDKNDLHRLNFPRPAQSSADVRALFIESLKQAREHND
jgi:hypothetical protein